MKCSKLYALITKRLALSLLTAGVVVMPNVGHALSLSNVPLVVSSSSQPNIVLLLDNSGSMNNIVPPDIYPEDLDPTNPVHIGANPWLVCPATNVLGTANQIDIRIRQTGGEAFFRVQDVDHYDWGNDTSTALTSKTKKCFDNDAKYTARLYASSAQTGSANTNGQCGEDDDCYLPSGYLPAIYTGKFLNWYFGSNNNPWGTGARSRPDTEQRMKVARDASIELVDSLSNVRMGLAVYDPANFGDGAFIEVGVGPLSGAGNIRADIKTAIGGVTPTTTTPLAEALEGIGAYFIADHDTNTLTLHPDAATPTTATANSVFQSDRVSYKAGVTQSSPVQNWCQKSYLIAVTDGRPQQDQNVDDDLADYDNDCTTLPAGATYTCDTGPNAHDRKTGTNSYDHDNNPATPDEVLTYTYESAGSDYFDDVAKALYEIDLRPDLTKPTGSGQINNITTYVIGFADDQVLNDPLVRDAGANGGGGFLEASNGQDLVDEFNNATTDILSRIGSTSAVTFNSSRLNANSMLYLAQFDTTRWSGKLLAFPISLNGTISTETWEAAALLDSQTPASRVIYTFNPDLASPGTVDKGVLFNTIGTLSQAMQDDLNMGPTNVADAFGQARLNYLRGNRSGEGSDYRFRTDVLGDLVHSSPIFVGPPGLPWTDVAPFPSSAGSLYSEFKSTYANRTPVVYVGSNDGMLHGFNGNADTNSPFNGGQELIAYVPNTLASTASQSGLHFVTDPEFQANHRYAVDLTPAVSDVFIKTPADSTARWRTVLVGGLRGGGRGLYALDVTNPSSFTNDPANAKNAVMWEFNSSQSANLGYTFSEPVIAMTNVVGGDGNRRWAAIFGNGYNSGGTQEAKLFIVFLDGFNDGVWANTVTPPVTDYIELSTDPTITANGLSSPAVVDLDGNGTVDRVYAGDLKGNMWVFDLCGTVDTNPDNITPAPNPNNPFDDVCATSTAGWGVALQSGGNNRPLFTAANDNGDVQPITVKPLVVKKGGGDTTLLSPNTLVGFGTGLYLQESDKANVEIQSYYTVWDNDSNLSRNRSDLKKRTVAETSAGSGIRVVQADPASTATVNYSNAVSGWYIELTAGERVNVDAKIRGGIVFFNTLIPDAQACSAGGTGWLMSVDVLNGMAATESVFDVNDDGVIDSSDSVTYNSTSMVAAGQKFEDGIPSESGFLGDNQYTPSSTGEVSVRKINVGATLKTERMNWRELRNF
ncbi:pilus assembly protein [Sedimenticola sp.]|uniref:pilus assembly protein n=1 Tax=Sedimenticola sp. TaxID=1940285 RepID=UPI003D136DF3